MSRYVAFPSACTQLESDEKHKTFLSRALDPPDMAAMDHALSMLTELGAISDNGEVTALGQHLVRAQTFATL